jgi:hypothetical protein
MSCQPRCSERRACYLGRTCVHWTLHLAAAIRIGVERIGVERIVSYDSRLADSARSLGLAVLAPA